MSKNILFAFTLATISLASCGGGWSEEQKNELRNRCIGNGSYDCDCYVESIVKAHEDPETYNALSKDKKDKLVESCALSEDAEASSDENLESF